MKTFLAFISLCLVSQLLVYGEPEAAPDFPARVKELQQQLDAASAAERDRVLAEYMETLANWLDWEDAKARSPDNTAAPLADYAAIREGLTQLQDPTIPETSQATLKRITLTIDDRIARWSNPEAYRLRNIAQAKILWSESNFNAAAESLKNARSTATRESMADLLFLEGINALSNGEFADGVQLLEKLIEEYPHSARRPASLYVLANTYWVMLNFEKAADRFKTLIDTFPTSVHARKSISYYEAVRRSAKQRFWSYD